MTSVQLCSRSPSYSNKTGKTRGIRIVQEEIVLSWTMLFYTETVMKPMMCEGHLLHVCSWWQLHQNNAAGLSLLSHSAPKESFLEFEKKLDLHSSVPSSPLSWGTSPPLGSTHSLLPPPRIFKRAGQGPQETPAAFQPCL